MQKNTQKMAESVLENLIPHKKAKLFKNHLNHHMIKWQTQIFKFFVCIPGVIVPYRRV